MERKIFRIEGVDYKTEIKLAFECTLGGLMAVIIYICLANLFYPEPKIRDYYKEESKSTEEVFRNGTRFNRARDNWETKRDRTAMLIAIGGCVFALSFLAKRKKWIWEIEINEKEISIADKKNKYHIDYNTLEYVRYSGSVSKKYRWLTIKDSKYNSKIVIKAGNHPWAPFSKEEDLVEINNFADLLKKELIKRNFIFNRKKVIIKVVPKECLGWTILKN